MFKSNRYTEKEVYVFNNLQYRILKECASDFGCLLRFKGYSDRGKKAHYVISDNYATNVYNALELFYSNIKKGR